MHELSIAQNILEIVRDSVPPDDRHLLKSVKVHVGKFSNVLPDSLKFCYDASINGTQFQSSQMIIEEIPFTIKCNVCNTEELLEDFIFICLECGSTDITILSGNELKVVEIELFDKIKEEK